MHVSKPGCLALGLLISCMQVANAEDTKRPSPAPIRWDLALINGLQVTATSLGIQDRIRVVTLGTSGCTPGSASLLMNNPEAGSETVLNIPIQGRSMQFEIEGHARADALLHIECKERATQGGAPRVFVLSLKPGSAG